MEQSKSIQEYTKFVDNLESLKERIWSGESTSEIVKNANQFLFLCDSFSTPSIVGTNGRELPDKQVMTSMIKVFRKEFEKVIEGVYCDLEREKLALYTSMSFMVGIFSSPLDIDIN